jgi:hypothetical protein
MIATLAPEEGEQGEGGRDMEHDDEGEVRRLLRRLLRDQVVPRAADPRGDQDRVTQAGDREQLGHTLDGTDDDRLQVGQHERRGYAKAPPLP